jgi:hypothetical protein
VPRAGSAAASGLPSDFASSNSSDNGDHAFSVTQNALGFQTLKVTGTANRSVSGVVVVNVLSKTRVAAVAGEPPVGRSP